jgi:hypothetical protein
MELCVLEEVNSVDWGWKIFNLPGGIKLIFFFDFEFKENLVLFVF